MLIPESVTAYVHDGGIRRAVREIIGLGPDEILDGVAWSELGRFYRAQLAARQLESEWATFALDAWEAIWGGLLDHWTALTPDEQMAYDADVGINLASLTDTDDDSLWFGRMFTSRSFHLYASLSATPSKGLRLKVSCDKADRPIAFGQLGPTKDEYDDWTSDLAVPLNETDIDLQPLRALAEAAVKIADDGSAPRGLAKS